MSCNMNKIRTLFGRMCQPSEVWGSGDKYYGLENQGATCYLNSVLQVLYMTKAFRERVTSHVRNNPETECIDSELSDLFLELDEKRARTLNITKKLKINNVNEQRDAADVYEKILRLTDREASQIFHGKLTNRNTCQKCQTPTQSEAGFWDLPLPLSNNDDYSVERCILDFFRPSKISRDNQMYCETCDEKCDAVLECEMTHAPEVLVLLLKRFEFDLTLGNYIKINSSVDVPLVLNIQNQIYELHAFVEHLGEQRFGRYIATIKGHHDGRWYTFDDSNVMVSRNQYFQWHPTEKSQTAYLLFYQKRKAAKYNGLVNLGATCYLNSVLQVLFMTEDFRESVKNHVRNDPWTVHIDRELSNLFSELEQCWAYTYNITRKLEIINVHEHRDAAEHYEKILRLTSPEASQIFHGELKNISTCQHCNDMTERTTGFWHLPLSLVDSEDGCSVLTSLVDFFHKDVQMYCEKCDETRDASLSCELKHHPEVLVFLIKRFEYDSRHMRNVKNNTAMAVPFTLHMPLTYELYACVEHCGELSYGHYIARAISRDEGRCYTFDDISVHLQSFQGHSDYKCPAAYLLFYCKQKEEVSAHEVEEAIADQNTNDEKEKEGEEESISNATVTPESKDDRAEPMSLDETINNGEAIHEQTPRILRIPENNRDHEERFEEGKEADCKISDRKETCSIDMDSFTNSFSKMSFSECKDSMLPQGDNSSVNQSHGTSNWDQFYNQQSDGERMNTLDEKTNSLYESGLRERQKHCGPKIKLCFRLKMGTQGEHEKTIDGDCSQVRVTSEPVEEVNSSPQPYPDNEDCKRSICHNRQSKSSDCSQTEPREPRTDTRRKERALAHESRFDGVESVDVTQTGETETLKFKPKERQGNTKQKAEHEVRLVTHV
ncbi:uncharacterized protein [Eucyclogobius newberryi]|uniref:uncharacterized protein n=1 Tax=Eucyclogobius newberryi TaxID=166745 RepID=UPI003B598E12